MLTESFIELTALGSVTVLALILVGLWMLDHRETSVLAASALFVSGSIVAVAKSVIARPRPDIAVEMLPYAVESYAFPSGHATLSFTAATILAFQFPRGKTYFYGIAVLVAFSRIYLGVHHATDVVAGAVLGVAVSLLVVNYRERILEGARTLYPNL